MTELSLVVSAQTKHSGVVSLADVDRRVSIYTYKITFESLTQQTNDWCKANAMFS